MSKSISLDSFSYDTSLLRKYYTQEILNEADEAVRDSLNGVLNMLPTLNVMTKDVFYKLVNNHILILWIDKVDLEEESV